MIELDKRSAMTPSHLVDRYHNDARFYALVQGIASWLHDGEIHAADAADAVIVAAELRRQRVASKR